MEVDEGEELEGELFVELDKGEVGSTQINSDRVEF